jgi:ABC-type multidrug transport system ATPase subunit
MKQKLALSCTLIHDPEILILDEPTTGVDPVSRTEFWAILHELKAQGVTILVSTPYMDEAMQCDAVAVMHAGRVLASGTPRDLIDGFGFTVYAVRDRDLVLRAPDMLAAEGVHSVQAFGDSIHVTALPETDASALAANLARALGRAVVLHRIEPSLEDVFIELVEARNAA